MIADSDQLLTVEEVSAWTRVPVPTLRTWRTRGGGPVATKTGRRVRYQRADVQAWLDAGREARTAVAS